MEENKKSKIILLICLIAAAVLIESLLIIAITPRSDGYEECDFEDMGCTTDEEYDYYTGSGSSATEAFGYEDETSLSAEPTEESDVDISEGSTTSGPIDIKVLTTRRLTEEDIAGMTREELRIARNEVYARHGYIFKSQELREYFGSKSWYQPMYSEVTSLSLNEFEQYNVDFIKRYE